MVMSPSQGAVKKWRRKPRNQTPTNLDDDGDFTHTDASVSSSFNTMLVNLNNGSSNILYGSGDQPDFGAREDSGNSSSRSSTAASASAPTNKHQIISLSGRNSVVAGDQHRNGGLIGTSKKARGSTVEIQNSHSSMGSESDSPSSNFVFVQGTNSIASKAKQSGSFLNHKHLPAGTSAFTSYAEFGDVSQQEAAADNSWLDQDENKHDHQDDAIAKSFTGLDSVYDQLAKELQKLKDVGKDDSKIPELESMLASGEVNTNLEDHFKKMIQAEVEYVVIRTTTESLTEDLLHEIKLNLRQKKAVLINSIEASKKEAENSKLETREDIKKVRNRVCKFTSCVMIQLILLLVTFYLQFSPHNVEVVPT